MMPTALNAINLEKFKKLANLAKTKFKTKDNTTQRKLAMQMSDFWQ